MLMNVTCKPVCYQVAAFENFWDKQVPIFEDFEWKDCGGKFPSLNYFGVLKQFFVTFPAPLPLFTTIWSRPSTDH